MEPAFSTELVKRNESIAPPRMIMVEPRTIPSDHVFNDGLTKIACEQSTY